MQAVICEAFDGPEALGVQQVPDPAPGAGEILVEVHAAAVSFADTLMVSGRYQMRPPTPFVPGSDAAGVVREVGSGVTRFRPGDRVACTNWTGAYGELMVTNEWKAVRIADGVDFEAAACIMYAYGTAHYALVERAKLRQGETVFVSGAAGGVGLAVVDLARHLGARVIAGIGTDDKISLLRDYGVTKTINYRTEDLRDRLKTMTNGDGVNVCAEMIGGEIFDVMTRLMAWEGRLMPIGFASGKIPSVPMNLPLLKNYSIVGVFYGAWMQRDPQGAARMFETLMDLLASGNIRPFVQHALPLHQVADAMRAIADRSVQGRITLKVR